MAAPEFVPRPPTERARWYRSPDHVPDAWTPSRDSDIGAEQPVGGAFGHQGPDQGYALGLADRFDDRITLGDGEHLADAKHAAVLVGLKRAAGFSRAPVIHDVEIGLRVFGYLDAPADPELVSLRTKWFEGIHHAHHYLEARKVPDLVPAEVLEHTPAQVAERHRADWRSLLVV